MWGKRIEYVQVYDDDKRSYQAKHSDIDYLKSLRAMGDNSVWVTETQYALESIRALKDEAEDPKEIAGMNKALKIIKSLAFAPYAAGAKIDSLRVQREFGT